MVRTVFVDTSALLGLLDVADPRHRDVREAFAGLADADLVTHGYVVAESLAVARRRFGNDGVIVLLDEILPSITLLRVDPEVHARVQARYRASLPSGVSFVDRISFALIEGEKIDAAFTTDVDFRLTGVALHPPTA